MLDLLIKLVFCHLLGDYFLQTDFIAQSKGKNLYHLFVHCALYCVPFYLWFGLGWNLLFVFLTHLIIDYLKAHKKAINYFTDQVLHYIVMLIYLLT